MARMKRIEVAEAEYHVYGRNNPGNSTLESDGAKRLFLELLACCTESFGWRVRSYCIMNNHYHFCLFLPEKNLSEGMQWLLSTYARRFNKRSRSYGHTFQGRFGSRLLLGEFAFQRVVKYIEQNPLKAQLCEPAGLDEYPFSSFGVYTGRRENTCQLIHNISTILERFSLGSGPAVEAYKSYILKAENKQIRSALESAFKKPIVAFGKKNREKARAIMDAHEQAFKSTDPEELAHILNQTASTEGAIIKALAAGFTQASIAQHLDVSQSTISRIARKNRA